MKNKPLIISKIAIVAVFLAVCYSVFFPSTASAKNQKSPTPATQEWVANYISSMGFGNTQSDEVLLRSYFIPNNSDSAPPGPGSYFASDDNYFYIYHYEIQCWQRVKVEYFSSEEFKTK